MIRRKLALAAILSLAGAIFAGRQQKSPALASGASGCCCELCCLKYLNRARHHFGPGKAHEGPVAFNDQLAEVLRAFVLS